MLTAKQILTEIADKFTTTPRTWIQGRYSDGHDGHCVEGALRTYLNFANATAAAYEQHALRVLEARTSLRAVINKGESEPNTVISEPNTVIAWNDDPFRSVDQVVSVLREAADRLPLAA